MPTYYAPGAYIEETSGPRPIEGVSTAVAAFVGFAPHGPANQSTSATARGSLGVGGAGELRSVV